jgi:hypothetical protein
MADEPFRRGLNRVTIAFYFYYFRGMAAARLARALGRPAVDPFVYVDEVMANKLAWVIAAMPDYDMDLEGEAAFKAFSEFPREQFAACSSAGSLDEWHRFFCSSDDGISAFEEWLAVVKRRRGKSSRV